MAEIKKDFSKHKEKGVPLQKDQPLKLLELFGGIGAPRKALQNLGYKLKSLDYVEVLPWAVMAYNSMFDCGYSPQDIRLWNMKPDILVHGSPCQDFSNEGRNDVNSGRSILYERTLQILDPYPRDGQPELTARPRVVIWENVPGLLHRHKEHLDHYIETMDTYGYHSYYSILTASDYKCPQDRDRLYTVSILDNTPFTFPEKTGDPLPLEHYIDKDVGFEDYPLSEAERDILSQLPDGRWTVKEATKKGYAEIEEYNAVNLAFPNSKTRRGRVGRWAKTITTSPRQAVFYNGGFRMLTAKEYMRLMGYKDKDYDRMRRAGLTEKQICSLAGNSICVPVLEAIFSRLHDMGII